MIEKQLKYFTIGHKAANLGKMYLQSKVQKILFNVPDRPVIELWHTSGYFLLILTTTRCPFSNKISSQVLTDWTTVE